MKLSTNEWNKYNHIHHQTTNSDSYSCYIIHDALKSIGEHNIHRILSSTYIIFKYHTHTTKYLHCYNIYKCNNYEYNKHNLISKSGYRFIAQHCTNVNLKAWSPPKSTIHATEFKKYIYKQKNK